VEYLLRLETLIYCMIYWCCRCCCFDFSSL
jgi:hypothetical protein